MEEKLAFLKREETLGHYLAGKHQLEAGNLREAIRHFKEALGADRPFTCL